tara:strand:- start:158 stop:367 length:210 start_codon:yes stop_codon:yes gene_type:complete
MKYKIDQWVIYKPFPDDEHDYLNSIEKRAVILHVYKKEEYYDYDIFIDGKGKIKKVQERHLFPDPASTY